MLTNAWGFKKKKKEWQNKRGEFICFPFAI